MLFKSTCLGRSGDNLVTENVEIGFPPPPRHRADMTLHVSVRYSTAQHVESQMEENVANRASRHRVSPAKFHFRR
jgi:hypothetical protein